MAKIKRGEKLGEIVGRRHLAAAAVLIFIGIVVGLSVLDYTAGQEIFLRHYFEPFMSSTQSAGFNICGKFGATFCAASYLAIGIASYMIPVYLVWLGIMCFQRSASAISKTTFAATILGLLLFSILWSVIQAYAGDGSLQSATFPSGWGGKFGAVIFDNLLRPFLNITGSALLIGSLYFICVVVVFVDSPIEAAKELAGVAKKSPHVFIRIVRILWIAVSWLPKKLLSQRSSDKDDDDEIAAMPRRIKISMRSHGEADETEIPQILHEQAADISPEQTSAETTQDTAATSSREEAPLAEDAAELPPSGNGAAEIEKPISDFTSRFDDEDCEEDFQQTKVVEFPQNGDLGKTEETDLPKAAAKAAKTAPNDKDAPIPKLEVAKIFDEKVDAPLTPKKKNGYVFPSLKLLAEPVDKNDIPEEDYNARMAEIVEVIGSFGVKVIPEKAYSGPVITRYEVKPATGVKISRIANLEYDITAGIKAEKVRIIAPVPGRGTVGIEVPNKHRLNVTMREVLQSKQWRDNKFEIPIALGKDATGVPIVANLKKMTHALIAGSTNSGKSVCINTIIISFLYKMTPQDLRLIMIDPKMVELQGYNSIPHMLIPVVSDVKKAAAALKWLTSEMMRRYQIFNKAGVRNIDGFNAKILKDKEQMERAEEEFADLTAEERQAALATSAESDPNADNIELPEEKLPYIVCIIDELADLMSVVGKEVEHYIARITQLARAAGIHMIIATQRPDVKVVTGLIKNNLPTRIAFKVTSQIDSRTILDRKGAEALIGWGDMLFLNNGTSDPVRAQGAFLSDAEIEAIVDSLKVNGEPQYAEDVQSQIDKATEEDDGDGDDGGKFGDPMIAKAVGVIRESNKTSISYLQRQLGIGYNRAAKIIEELEDRGLIGPDKGQGQRDIFLD